MTEVSDPDTLLAVELRFFEQELPSWLEIHPGGKFALIKGERLLGVFDSAENAYRHGVETLGDIPMLIKRIALEEPAFSAHHFRGIPT